MNIEATLDAIKILRAAWTSGNSVGNAILISAYMRMEREATNYLTGRN